ncbi:heterogeneous nuclear ribonucleoprotein L-like, isoform CRA_a [Mus musculus]|nr:heterogeneous nuclear ribonucleoprotein L-like, isoform CRA_a [Mus musculus]
MSSSSSSSPKEETYEEDREFESQAKRLKTEEGEIVYSAEESENRQEATPQAGSDSDSGGGDGGDGDGGSGGGGDGGDGEEGEGGEEGDEGDGDEGGSGGDEGGSGGGALGACPCPRREVEVIIKFLFPLLSMFEGSVNLLWKLTLWRHWRNLGQYAM